MIGSSRVPDLWTSLAISNPVTEAAGSRGRRLKLRPPFGALCEALVIVRDLKHHLLRYFVFHIIGKTARFVGEFAPGLTTTRCRVRESSSRAFSKAPRPAVLERRAGTCHDARG
jgi:hypothetical protein